MIILLIFNSRDINIMFPIHVFWCRRKRKNNDIIICIMCRKTLYAVGTPEGFGIAVASVVINIWRIGDPMFFLSLMCRILYHWNSFRVPVVDIVPIYFVSHNLYPIYTFIEKWYNNARALCTSGRIKFGNR